MKKRHELLLMTGVVLLFWAAFGFFRVVRAQPQQGSEWVTAQAAKLSPDIHPETLSRATRPKESDFTTTAEKKVFHDLNDRPGSKQLVSKWLGPTGTRLQIPELAEVYNRQIGM